MRISFVSTAMVGSMAAAMLVAGCRSSAAPGGGGSSGGEGTVEVTFQTADADQFGREDRVSAGHAPTPDGHPDAALTIQVRGRVNGFVLTICEDTSTNTGTQWDTVVGQNPLPEGFQHRLGADTWVLGVVDARGRLLNNADGSFPDMTFERMTTLRLFASLRDTLLPGRLLCLTVLRPEGVPARASAELRGGPRE